MTASRDESKDIQVSAKSLTLTREDSTYPLIGYFIPYVAGAPSDLSGWVRFVTYDQYTAIEKERNELRLRIKNQATEIESSRQKITQLVNERDELRDILTRGGYSPPTEPYDNECPEGVPGFNYRG